MYSRKKCNQVNFSVTCEGLFDSVPHENNVREQQIGRCDSDCANHYRESESVSREKIKATEDKLEIRFTHLKKSMKVIL